MKFENGFWSSSCCCSFFGGLLLFGVLFWFLGFSLFEGDDSEERVEEDMDWYRLSGVWHLGYRVESK